VSEDDRLTELRRRIADEHFADPALGIRLRGDDEEDLRADAEELREQAGIPGSGRPGLGAAVFVARQRARRLAQSVLGWSEKGAP
jgi:hypothetical protein